MKKVFSIFICLSMVFSMSVWALATDDIGNCNGVEDLYGIINLTPETITSDEIAYFSSIINGLSDEEYDDLLAYCVVNSSDHENLIETLNLVGIELSEINCVRHSSYDDYDGIAPLTEVYDATMYIYDSSRTGHTNRRISVAYQLLEKERRPASYDAVIMYYNSEQADFVDYSCESNYSSLKDGSQAFNGTLVFNFYDELANTNVSYSTLELDPNIIGSDLAISVIWYHSYSEWAIDFVLDPSVSYSSSDGITGAIGATIDFGTDEQVWQLSDVKYF